MTIEERADKYYYDSELEEGWCQEKCAEVGYIQGATDQRKIDIEKASQYIYNNLTQYFADQSLRDRVLYEFEQAMKKTEL